MGSPADQPPSESFTTLVIANQIAELARVTSWLEQIAKEFLLSERTVFSLNLVLDEALTNIISYAYQDRFSHDIVIKFVNRDDQVLLEITDDGIAFNPFAEHRFRESPDLESASIGGRGIHLIRSFTDKQEYQRINHNTNMIRVSILKTTTNKPRQLLSGIT